MCVYVYTNIHTHIYIYIIYIYINRYRYMSISIYIHVCFIEGATRSAESYGVYLLAPPISLPTTVPPKNISSYLAGS